MRTIVAAAMACLLLASTARADVLCSSQYNTNVRVGFDGPIDEQASVLLNATWAYLGLQSVCARAGGRLRCYNPWVQYDLYPLPVVNGVSSVRVDAFYPFPYPGFRETFYLNSPHGGTPRGNKWVANDTAYNTVREDRGSGYIASKTSERRDFNWCAKL